MMKSGNMKEEERKRKEGRKKEGSLGLCLSVHRTKQKAEGRKPSRAKKTRSQRNAYKESILNFFSPLLFVLSCYFVVCLSVICMYVFAGTGAGVGVVRRGEARRGEAYVKLGVI